MEIQEHITVAERYTFWLIYFATLATAV